MRALCSLLLLLSVAGVVGGIGTLIYRHIKNKKKKPVILVVVGSVILFFISMMAMPDLTPEQKTEYERKAAEKQAERIAEETAADERRRQEEAELQNKAEEEKRQKLEAESAEKDRLEREHQEEIELQQQADKIREEQNNMIRQINLSLGGGNHLVSVDGFESKTIMFQIDVGTKDIEVAKEISVNAIHKVINALPEYKIDKITVMTVDKGSPVGLFSYDENGIILLNR